MKRNRPSTVFVLGAGATRGCSFVKATVDPCLPPLDRDFFAQLQRVQNAKHRELIDRLLEGVVSIFGTNFSVGMEEVFTTLEHTIRMLKVTGDNRAFDRARLQNLLVDLRQAVAAVLEDSLTPRTATGGSAQRGEECKHHARLVADVLEPRDTIISFNYDCVADRALQERGSGKWNARYGYALPLGPGGRRLVGHDRWQPDSPATRENSIHHLKLHGSLHFRLDGTTITLKQRPYTVQHGKLKFEIIPPLWDKRYDEGFFSELWKGAAEALGRAKRLVVVGYSLPPTDLHATALFRTALKREGLRSLVVVNPSSEDRRQIRGVIRNAISGTTRVVSFDCWGEFLATDPASWRA